MADHALDREPGIARIADDINTLKNQLSELRTLQLQGATAVNMQSTGSYTATTTTIAAGAAAIFGFHLVSSISPLIFCVFSYSIYEGSTPNEASLIGGQNTLGYRYKWTQWRDWGEANLDGHVYNVSDRIWIENRDTVSRTIFIKAEWRYIVNGGTVSLA